MLIDSVFESIIHHDADHFEKYRQHITESEDKYKNEMLTMMMEFASSNVFIVFVRLNPNYNYHQLNLYSSLFNESSYLNYRNCYIINRAKWSHLSTTEQFRNEYMYSNVRIIFETLKTLGVMPTSNLYRPALSMGHKYADLLFEDGVEINWHDIFRYVPRKERVEWCLKHGMDPNLQVAQVATRLQFSTMSSTNEPIIFVVSTEAIQILVEHGADPNAVNSRGETILDLLYLSVAPSHTEHKELFIFLLRNGVQAKKSIRNDEVQTWLEGRHPEQLVRNETYSFLDSSTQIPVELNKLICQYFHL